MSSSTIRAGGAFIEIFTRDKTKKQLSDIGNRFKSWGAGIAATGGVMAAASATVLGGIMAAVNQFTGVGSQLADMSARTGVAGEALSELGFAAEQGGGSLADLEMALKHMAKTTGHASEDSFLAVADAISKIEDPGERAQAAMQAFGKSGTKLLPMLEQIQKLREQGRQMGNTLNGEAIAAADKLGDSIGVLQGTVKGMALQIGAAVAPLVQFAVEGLQPIATGIVHLIKENPGLIRAFVIGAAVVGVLGAALVAAGGALMAVGAFVGSLSGIVLFLGSAFAAITSPVGIAIGIALALGAGLAALATWFVTCTDAGRGFAAAIMAALAQVWAFFQKTFKGISDALMSGNLALAGKIAMATLKVGWQAGVAGLMDVWRNFSVFIVDTILKAVTRAANVFDGFVQGALAGMNAMLSAGGLPTIEAEIPSVAKAIGDPLAGFGALVKGGADAALARSQQELQDVLAEHEALIQKAADLRVKMTSMAHHKQFSNVAKQVEQMNGPASAAGTFSGFAAGALGNQGAANKMLEELKKQTETENEIAQLLEDIKRKKVGLL